MSKLDGLETQVLNRLRETGSALAAVESCTGGRLASRITSIPGSSEAFWGSAVTYDNSAKVALAQVPAALLEKHGAVSAPVAEAMARGGLEQMRSSLANPSANLHAKRLVCVSTTGIAGPSGGSPEKPVGLCWIGIVSEGRPPRSLELRENAKLPRTRLQDAFTDAALQAVLNELNSL